MLKPSMELTQNQTVSDYSLVVGIAKKAREIASEAEIKGEILEEKAVDLAVQEYIHHKFQILESTVCEECGRLDCICAKPSQPEMTEDSSMQEGAPQAEPEAIEAALEPGQMEKPSESGEDEPGQ